MRDKRCAEAGPHQQIAPIELGKGYGFEKLVNVSRADFERGKADSFQRFGCEVFAKRQVLPTFFFEKALYCGDGILIKKTLNERGGSWSERGHVASVGFFAGVSVEM